MQYFPVLTADEMQLIFTRRAGDGPNDDEDLMISKKDEHGRWSIPTSISKNINTPLNEGTCTISADGRRLIFTSCSGRDGIGSCDLYESIKVGEVWTTPKNLGRNVNTNEWESQPSLSADGRTLYFVSDRRSGLGEEMCGFQRLMKQVPGPARSMRGNKLIQHLMKYHPLFMPTTKRYILPLMGYLVLGDTIFSMQNGILLVWDIPKNIGNLINDHDDQFSFFITADGNKGYYSHEETLPSGFSRVRFMKCDPAGKPGEI